VPSDADSLIAYQQQLATSAPEPWISTGPLRSWAPVGCAFPVESPVRVLIMAIAGETGQAEEDEKAAKPRHVPCHPSRGRDSGLTSNSTR
jgi:hypothetical protein